METVSKTCADGRCWRDLAGVVASGACVVHCLAMPLVITYLPLLGLSWLTDHRFHQWMAAGCAVVAFSAFVPGYCQHRRLAPFALGAIGTLLLTFAALSQPSNCCSACATDRTRQPCMAATAGFGDSNLATCKASADRPDPLYVTTATCMAWLTPLGGCLLVAGHFANMRGRGCCTRPNATQ
jgi:hypothetical protein